MAVPGTRPRPLQNSFNRLGAPLLTCALTSLHLRLSSEASLGPLEPRWPQAQRAASALTLGSSRAALTQWQAGVGAEKPTFLACSWDKLWGKM